MRLLIFMSVCVMVLADIAGVDSGNLSTVNCTTDMMDVLFLAFNKGGWRADINQLDASIELSRHLANFHSNKTTPHVRFAAVYDRFSALDPDVNVKDWEFHTLNFELNVYGLHDFPDVKHEYKGFNETIELKVKFIKRLFSEMGSVRENVSHVAVLYIDGFGMSREESRKIPQFVEEQDTGIQIFILVINGEYDREMMSQFRFAQISHEHIYGHFLVMQVCKQCLKGWFQFEHNEGSDTMSCYHLLDNTGISGSLVGYGNCFVNGSFPATFESYEEVHFIQSRLKSEFEKLGINNTTGVSIGLFGELTNKKDTFCWIVTYPVRKRPLIIDYWLPHRPIVGSNRACVVWLFLWAAALNDAANISVTKGHFLDGWTDAGCDVKVRFSLCEVALQRRSENTIMIRIKPATFTSFQQSLTRGNFIKFEDNAVSISTQIAGRKFKQLLSEVNFELFPLFDCGEDAGEYRYISYILVCDSLNDCSNKRDESRCLTAGAGFSLQRDEFYCKDTCKGIFCCNGLCLPLTYDNDGQVDCNVCVNIAMLNTIDESNVHAEYLKTNKPMAFICYHGKCLFSPELTSNISECDRPENFNNTNERTAIICPNSLGRSFWAPACVYLKDKYGSVLDCRRMAHLDNCKYFVCPEGYVKCPNTYCIPQHYVLDGENDCPTGNDEHIEHVGPCIGNFACWDSKVCLHPDLVCDGHPDCPHRDDEIDCYEGCAEGFRCVSGTVTITNYSLALGNIQSTTSKLTRYVNFSGSEINVHQCEYLTKLSRVMFIVCSRCSLTTSSLELEQDFRFVQHFELSYNLIREFDGSQIDCHKLYNLRYLNLSHNTELYFVDYLQFPFLEVLDLSYTGLLNLRQSALRELPNLKYLDLSFTSISSFKGENKFPNNFYPHTLNVRGVHIDVFDEDFFNGLYVSQHLYTDRFELCCPRIRGVNIPPHVCHAPDDAISSCFDLIAVNVQRVLLWVVAVLAVLGNTTVIVYRVIWDRSVLRTGYGLFVTNLGISDFIMGVYLFIIAGADYYFRDIYVLYDKTWRESVLCKCAGFLVALSCETSIFFVSLITLDRYLLMKYPLGQVKFTEICKSIALSIAWILGGCLALIPIIFRFETYSSNAMCLGLPLTTKPLNGWRFSFTVFIAINMLLCLAIAGGQMAIFRAMAKNRSSAGSTSNAPSRRALDIMVAKQLLLVALSNFACWFPIGVMGLLSVTSYEIGNDVFAWITVIVLPINSAANPLLYTIPVVMDKWDKFKFREKRPQFTNKT